MRNALAPRLLARNTTEGPVATLVFDIEHTEDLNAIVNAMREQYRVNDPGLTKEELEPRLAYLTGTTVIHGPLNALVVGVITVAVQDVADVMAIVEAMAENY